MSLNTLLDVVDMLRESLQAIGLGRQHSLAMLGYTPPVVVVARIGVTFGHDLSSHFEAAPILRMFRHLAGEHVIARYLDRR